MLFKPGVMYFPELPSQTCDVQVFDLAREKRAWRPLTSRTDGFLLVARLQVVEEGSTAERVREEEQDGPDVDLGSAE